METDSIEKDNSSKSNGTCKSDVTIVNQNVQTISKSSCEEIAKRSIDIGENGKSHINRDKTSNKNTIANQKRLLETNGDKCTSVKQGCVKECKKINKNAMLRKSQSCVEVKALKEKTIPHSESFGGNSKPSSILESDGENIQTKAHNKRSSIEKEKQEDEEAMHQKLPQKQQHQLSNDQQDEQQRKQLGSHKEHLQISTATSVLTTTTTIVTYTTTAGSLVTNTKSKQQLTGQQLKLNQPMQQLSSEKEPESMPANNTYSPFTPMTPFSCDYSTWLPKVWQGTKVDQFDDNNESTNKLEITEITTNTSVKASIVQTGLSHGMETESKTTIITSSKQTDLKTSKSKDSSICKPLVGSTSSRSAAPPPSAAPPKSPVTPKSAGPPPNSAAPPPSAAPPKSIVTPKSAAPPKSTLTPKSAAQNSTLTPKSAAPPISAAQSPNSAAPSKSTTALPSAAAPRLTPAAAAVSTAPDKVSGAPTSTAESLPPKNLHIASEQTGKTSLSDSFSSPDVDYVSVHYSSSFPHQSSSLSPLTSPSEIPVSLTESFTTYERISEESMTSFTPSAIVPSTSCSARTYSNRRNRKDFIILSADADQEDVEKFRDHFLNDIRVHDLTVDLFNEIDGGQTAMLSLETLHDRYIYILVFGTPNFAKDKVFSFLSEIILTSGLQDANGKEDRVIPVWQNKHCKRSIYQLQILKGFEYFNYLANPVSLSASSYLKCVKHTVLEGRKKFP